MEDVSLSEPGSPEGCQVMSMKRGPPEPIRSNLEIRLTAPDVVRGGKNSSENQWSPDSIRRFILSRSRSVRSVSSTGVEHLELSLELSPLLLAPLESLLEDCQPMSALWFTMFPVLSASTFSRSPRSYERTVQFQCSGSTACANTAWTTKRMVFWWTTPISYESRPPPCI